jgi:hypothetical protein
LDFFALPSPADPGDVILKELESLPLGNQGDQGSLVLEFQAVIKIRSNCTDILGGTAGDLIYCDELVSGLLAYAGLEDPANLRCADFLAETILDESISNQAGTLQFTFTHEGHNTFYYGNEVLVYCSLTTEFGQTITVQVTQAEVDWSEAVD